MTPAELPAAWREEAAGLRRYGAEPQALTLEAKAAELEASLREAADVELTLAEAAIESGYSERRLRELLHDGDVPNAGRKHRPRIRRADLPRRPGKASTNGYDASAGAARLLRRGP